MTIPVDRFTLILLIFLSIVSPLTAQTVAIPDPNLRAAIETELGKASGDPITTSDMATLIWLYAVESNISDLTGLEHAINLEILNLVGNTISDISSLSGLTNLILLHLNRNLISDLSPLSGLANLRQLDLGGNRILDISSLLGLTNLRQLDLVGNRISDISSLSGLTNLTYLSLDGNLISDLSALVANTGLGGIDMVDVQVNPLGPVSIDTHIPALQSRGVIVKFDDIVAGVVLEFPDANLRAVIEGQLGKTSGDTITTSDMATLTQLDARHSNISDLTGLEHAINLTVLNLGGNAISDISVVSGLTNLQALHLQDNSVSDISAVSGLINLAFLALWNNLISDISALVTNTGLGSRNEVHLQGNPLSYQSIHIHIPALQSRGVTVRFDDEAHPALLKISGDNQKGASFTPLSQPYVVEAQNANGSALAEISVTFSVIEGGGTLSTTITRTDENGRAESMLTLGPNLGINTVSVSAAGIEVPVVFNAISDTKSPLITADVNSDGSVNILDLVLVASELGNTGQNLMVDVNGDGIVNILDLVLTAGMFDSAAAAPSAQPQLPETITAVEVQGWLTDASLLEAKDPIMKRGFLILKQLLVSLTPTETELLANYPNPFNPETWIPYRLAEDAFVTLTIYNGAGRVVRTLDVGHRIAAVYENRSKAIYWDGRNQVGETVASGVYFYHLAAGDYSATRKMVILK